MKIEKDPYYVDDVDKFMAEIDYIDNGPKFEPKWSKFEPYQKPSDKKKSTDDD